MRLPRTYRTGGRRPVILVTGFGPFPGQQHNASGLLVTALASVGQWRLPSYRIVANVLATEWEAGPAQLIELLERYRPVLVVHFGVSRHATGFVVETRARNVRSATPDACGMLPDQACVESDGPEERRVTLPTREIADRLKRLSLPVQVSRDAGAYLCNAILYRSLTDAQLRGKSGGMAARRGFIHIPDRLVWSAEARQSGLAPVNVDANRRLGRASRLEWEQAVSGGLEILAVSAAVGSAHHAEAGDDPPDA